MQIILVFNLTLRTGLLALLGARTLRTEQRASLLVTSALLVVTMFSIRNKCQATRNRCLTSSNKDAITGVQLGCLVRSTAVGAAAGFYLFFPGAEVGRGSCVSTSFSDQ